MALINWPESKKSRELKALQAKVTDLEQRALSGVNIPGELLNRLLDGDKGVAVNEDTALTLSAFYAGVNILCDSLNIPVGVFKREKDGNRMPVTESDPYEFQVYKLLHVSPNLTHTPAQWTQLMEMSRIIYGNGYSLIIRNKLGEPLALQWFHPYRVDCKFNGKEITYDIKKEDGSYYLQGIKALDMIHVKNMSLDGVVGKGVIELAAESMGFGLATQKAGNNFFNSGMTSKVVLSHPGSLGGAGSNAKKNLQDSFESELKKRSTIVLEEGTKVFTLTIPPEQAQFLESRKFSVTEVSRWLNIPEFMLANMDPTFSNIEGFSSFFVTHNVRPRVRIYEQEFNWKLLTNYDKFYTEYNMNALMRADLKARYDSYAIAIQNRIMNPNEARALENMNGYDGGDKFENPNVTPGEPKKENDAVPDTNGSPDEEAGI